MAELIELNDYISYFPAGKDPLSSDVVFIKAKDCTWVYDVGASKEAALEVEKVCRKKRVVLSHFHPDHVWNLVRTSASEIFVSENTKKYVKQGTVVTDTLHFEGGGKCPDIKIFEIPSSHAKGCLGIQCGEYAFFGDATYAKEAVGHHTYNSQLMKSMIDLIKELDCRFICLDHSRAFVHTKEEILELMESIYETRDKSKSEISVEHFFNIDGSVKEEYQD